MACGGWLFVRSGGRPPIRLRLRRRQPWPISHPRLLCGLVACTYLGVVGAWGMCKARDFPRLGSCIKSCRPVGCGQMHTG